MTARPRNDLVERSAPFLPAGSEIRQAFICQTAPHFSFFVITYLTGLMMFWIKYRCVVVTQDAIYVLESSKLSGAPSRSLWWARCPATPSSVQSPVDGPQ